MQILQIKQHPHHLLINKNKLMIIVINHHGAQRKNNMKIIATKDIHKKTIEIITIDIIISTIITIQ